MNEFRNTARPQLFRIGFMCLAVVALFFFLSGWYFWDNAGRSQDRSGVLQAMAKLPFSSQKILPVSGRSDLLLAKSELGENRVLNAHLSKLGWKYVDRGGATSYFRKANQEMIVTHLSMTELFMLHRACYALL